MGLRRLLRRCTLCPYGHIGHDAQTASRSLGRRHCRTWVGESTFQEHSPGGYTVDMPPPLARRTAIDERHTSMLSDRIPLNDTESTLFEYRRCFQRRSAGSDVTVGRTVV